MKIHENNWKLLEIILPPEGRNFFCRFWVSKICKKNIGRAGRIFWSIKCCRNARSYGPVLFVLVVVRAVGQEILPGAHGLANPC